MAEKENVERIQRIYATFGDGDINALIETFSEDVKWSVSGSREVIPWAGDIKGRAALTDFFQCQLGMVNFLSCVPEEFIAQGDTVVCIGTDVVRVVANGANYETPWVHIYTFRGDDICKFREFYDTHATAQALQGE